MRWLGRCKHLSLYQAYRRQTTSQGNSFWKSAQQGNGSLLSAQGNTVAQSWAQRDARPWSQRPWVDGYALADHSQSAGPDFVLNLRGQGHLGQTVHTRAAAQSFFSLPPDNTDSVDDEPSLFVPFWQAR